MATTPYMSLSLPTPSTSTQWGTTLNAALTLVDSHNHTSGQGTQVPTAGVNINADFPFNGYNATTLRAARFTSQSAPLALSSDANCIYVSGGNLYYNNGSGTAVQITSGTTLSASSLGGISGLGGTTASASYSSGSSTFTFLSNTSVGGIIDAGPRVIRSPSTNNGCTLQVPSALGTNYTLTLLSGLPASTMPLSVSASGVISAGQITRPQLPDVGFQASSSIGVFTCLTPSTVTGLSVAITTTGRPVVVMLVALSSGAYVAGDSEVIVTFDRDAGAVTWAHTYSHGAGTTDGPIPPPILDAPPAGTHTYIVKLNLTGTFATIANVQLVAYEL